MNFWLLSTSVKEEWAASNLYLGTLELLGTITGDGIPNDFPKLVDEG